MHVVTRFAPSPTGFLHIGGGRTALFNWLFARHHGGTFQLRIEDTDRARSTQAAVDAIFDGLEWLGLDWDGEAVMQFARAPRHAEVANQLLAEGKAYRCYCTPEELTALREQQRAQGLPMRYPGIWRDRDAADAPADTPFVVRLRAPTEGETLIPDLVQGEVRVANAQLDDMILLRADGTPTYMLSVVVDDHDMGVTHVIRGDDHLTNAFRQTQLYRACGWEVPVFAHIPLIHGPDGAKLSKRHGALGVDAYRDMGFLPEAMRNYLLRLGWGHGDDEIIPTDKAIEWFDLDGVGRSASRFDLVKLTQLNGHYLRSADDSHLVALITPLLAQRLGHAVPEAVSERLRAGMAGLKERAKTLNDLADSALFYACARPLAMDAKAAVVLADADSRDDLVHFVGRVNGLADWTRETVEAEARLMAEERGIKLGRVAQPLRAALAGATVSPPIFEVMEVLGREESLGRIADALGQNPAAAPTAA
jgi:glutamyl-tRNA synthetase